MQRKCRILSIRIKLHLPIKAFPSWGEISRIAGSQNKRKNVTITCFSFQFLLIHLFIFLFFPLSFSVSRKAAISRESCCLPRYPCRSYEGINVHETLDSLVALHTSLHGWNAGLEQLSRADTHIVDKWAWMNLLQKCRVSAWNICQFCWTNVKKEIINVFLLTQMRAVVTACWHFRGIWANSAVGSTLNTAAWKPVWDYLLCFLAV